jgi:Mrp family chromosome partitioning ATPase
VAAANFRCRWIFKGRLAVSETVSAGDELPALDPFALRDFWLKLHETFGLIVVDCAPRNESADCLALAPYMDSTIIVLSAEDTRVPVARRLRDELTEAGGRIAGVVFNKRRFYIPKFIYRRLGG